jgi:hypothetical protein
LVIVIVRSWAGEPRPYDTGHDGPRSSLCRRAFLRPPAQQKRLPPTATEATGGGAARRLTESPEVGETPSDPLAGAAGACWPQDDDHDEKDMRALGRRVGQTWFCLSWPYAA